jgi:uncharacterized membrane protein YphA (DoxX/SURF4 family)
MQFLRSLKSVLTKENAIAAVTWLVRILVGVLFIYSGFVKGIDPWGTIYKFEEYLAAMGLPNYEALTLVAVFTLFSYEFLVGVFILFGCYRRSAPVMAILFMAVMLPITLWIALKNPVSDCGCFGDALTLSNWTTFWKNVVLVILIVWLLIYNRRSRALINPAFQWISFLGTFLFIALIGAQGYWRQPFIDFRAYKVGTELTSLTENSTDPTSFIFIYEKDGVTKEFTEDDELPYEEEGWTFKERRDIFPEYNDRNTEKERNFHLWDVNGEEDVTSDVILTQGNQIILTIPDLSKVTTALTWKINSLQDWCEQHDIDILAAVSGSAEEIGIWSDLSMPEYPIYTADDTVIKELVRGNPGIVFLRDGKIVWKSTLDALDADDFMSDRIGDDPMSFSYDADTVLHRYILIYAVFLVILIAMSFTSRIIRKYGK